MKINKFKQNIINGMFLLSLGAMIFFPNNVFASTVVPPETQTKVNAKEEVKKDTKKPEIVWAYVYNSEFHMEVIDEGGYDQEDIIFEIDGKKSKDGKIGLKVDVPSKLTLTIEDLAGNKLVESFSITMENQILKGADEISEKIKSKIEKNQESDYKVIGEYDFVVEGEYGKILDVYKAFKNVILREFGPHNQGDILISTAGLSVDKEYKSHLNKEGIFTFKISHVFYTKDTLDVYVYVDNDGVKYTNINDMNVKNPGLISGPSVRLKDFIEFDLIKDGYTPVTSYIVSKDMETGKMVDLNENISLEDDKYYKFSFKNILTNKEYFIEFKKAQPIEIKTASYSDVRGDHWAFYSIKELTLNSFINGYPDNTFRPNANITVREFATILSRYRSNLELKSLKPVLEEHYIQGINGEWGYIETKSILSTIPRFKIGTFNFTDINRPITREEVAFLISNSVNLDMGEIRVMPSDILTSPYSMEILNLIGSDVIKGYPDYTFKPTNKITRAEIATIFERLLYSEKENNIYK